MKITILTFGMKSSSFCPASILAALSSQKRWPLVDVLDSGCSPYQRVTRGLRQEWHRRDTDAEATSLVQIHEAGNSQQVGAVFYCPPRFQDFIAIVRSSRAPALAIRALRMQLQLIVSFLHSTSLALALINVPALNCVTEHGPYSLRHVPTFTETITITSTYRGNLVTPTANAALPVLDGAPSIKAAQTSTETGENTHSCLLHSSSVTQRVVRVIRLVSAFFGSTTQYSVLLN